MATVSLRQLMNLKYISEPTVDDVISGLNTIKTIKAVQEVPNLVITIDSALIALETYKTIIDIYEKIIALSPYIEKASKIGATIMNPSMGAQLANDVVMEVQQIAINTIKEIPQKVIEAVLDYQLEI